jgi:hypothetical protein
MKKKLVLVLVHLVMTTQKVLGFDICAFLLSMFDFSKKKVTFHLLFASRYQKYYNF